MGKSAFYVSEVVFGPDGYAAVTNGSEEPADPGGMFVCQFPSYPEVPAGEIAPGESVRVPASDLGELKGESGEVALYLAAEWSNPDAIAGYVQWGETGHKREEPAIAAGVWEQDSFVAAGEASGLAASGPSSNSAAAWSTTPA